MNKNKLAVVISAFIISAVLMQSNVYALSEVNKNEYNSASERLQVFGIKSTGTNVKRKQFAYDMVVAAGLLDQASGIYASSMFSDVSSKDAYSPYISKAVDNGYITGKADGKFHPDDYITFSEACTSMVKALGYVSDDLSGIWPYNYIQKAKDLGITKDINLKTNDVLPGWAEAIMLNRLMDADIKKTDTNSETQTFVEAMNYYSEYLVLETSKTSSDLESGQILTDKGILRLNDSNMNVDAGKTYMFHVDDSRVLKVSSALTKTQGISVVNFADDTVIYKQGSENKRMTLPQNITYYHNGVKTDFETVKTIIKPYSSIMFKTDDYGNPEDYAVIYDPVYSKPEIVLDYNFESDKKIGDIDLSSDPLIVRNDEQATINDISVKDAVYKVSDVWNTRSYVLVMHKRISGTITAIEPDSINPVSVTIKKVQYYFSKDINYDYITPASFGTDDYVTLILGYDGKIVAVY